MKNQAISAAVRADPHQRAGGSIEAVNRPRDWIRVASPATSSEILSIVCRVSGVSSVALRGPARQQGIVHWRMVAAHLMRKHRPVSMACIGRLLGGRDHTTIIHSLRRVEQNPSEFQSDIERVEALL